MPVHHRSIALLAVLPLALVWPAGANGQTNTSPIQWTQLVKAAATSGSISKTAGCNDCPDAGGISAAQLTGDGFVEFAPLTGHRVLAGLGSDLSESTSLVTDFAFSFWPGGM